MQESVREEGRAGGVGGGGGGEKERKRERESERKRERGIQVVVVPNKIAKKGASERGREREREREREEERETEREGTLSHSRFPRPLAWGLWVSDFEFRDSGYGIRNSSLQLLAQTHVESETSLDTRSPPLLLGVIVMAEQAEKCAVSLLVAKVSLLTEGASGSLISQKVFIESL